MESLFKSEYKLDLEELFDYPNLPLSVDRLKDFLAEAKTVIDELREQNIIMRKVMVLIDKYSVDEPAPSISCAWCGSGEEVHDDSCLVLAVRILLPTIPEIK